MTCASLALTMHLLSAHADPGFNNNNPGIGITCERPSYSLSLGTYRNSINNNTVYAVASKESSTAVRLGAVIGVATGYGHTVVPIGGLTAATTVGDRQLRLLVIPKVRAEDSLAVHFMFNVPVGGK